MDGTHSDIDFQSTAEECRIVKMATSYPTDEIIRFMGGGSRGRCSRVVRKKMAYWTEHLDSMVKPRVAYSVQWIKRVEKARIHLEGGPVLISAKMARTMRDCDALICFVATVGGKLQNELSRLSENGSMSEAYILDAVASVGVEQLVDRFHKEMGSFFRNEGRGVSLRFSPGYCDWPITEQRKVFSLVDGQTIGVRLHDSCLMEPSKSVSGVFGITTHHQKEDSAFNPCSICKKTDCIARRTV